MAVFHGVGMTWFLRESEKRWVIGSNRKGAESFRNRKGKLSRPGAVCLKPSRASMTYIGKMSTVELAVDDFQSGLEILGS